MNRIAGGLVLLAVPLLPGCVTSSAFDAKVGELAACHKDLAVAQGQLRTQTEATASGRRAQERCAQAQEVARQQTARLEARESRLREQLHAELLAKDVEIDRLKDQLSIRVLDRILFRSGSADVLPAGQAVLDKLATVLAGTDDRIRVEGHTDIVPIGKRLKEKYFSNWELSASRATSVVRYFEHRHDLDPTRMEAVGLSKFHPVASDDTPEGLQRNRRVEIVLTSPRVPEPADMPTN